MAPMKQKSARCTRKAIRRSSTQGLKSSKCTSVLVCGVCVRQQTAPVSFREKMMTLPKRTPPPMQRPKSQAIENL